METGLRQLYWVTDPEKVHLSQLGDSLRGSANSNFVVFCNGISPEPDSHTYSAALRSFLLKRGIQLIEMHGHCEDVIPSLSRVLKTDVVYLVDDEYCACDPADLDEVRLELKMHSIQFYAGLSAEDPGIPKTAMAALPSLAWVWEAGWKAFPMTF